MKSSRSLTFLLALVLVAMPLGACARTSESNPDSHSTPAADVKPAASQSAKNAGILNISLGELEGRLLRFVSAFKVPGDMASTRLESAVGIRLGPPIDAPDSWYEVTGISLAEGYTLNATHFPMKQGFSRIQVSVHIPDGKDPTRKPTAVCIWDAATLSKKLEAIGYKGGGRMPFQNGWIRQHWRSIGDGKQGFSVALLIYETGDEPPRECVSGLQIDGGDA
ncbi:hypothetical protein JH274_21330 [Xanthomonas campestris pv. incanae]|uniref:hypothetical protein n=1 Tax=Xanthomonas campestris TaxID=339 RepID=UPI002367AE73|nr:hypothetical protein [Xanthomonas campestris]WDJ85177.1 hypothetical protein JH279_00335 [Xanthomonas campestris pv. incanae]WDK25729.1 hypothetical protein JH274_21330 [Xanthomonas campestris pv. incanae]